MDQKHQDFTASALLRPFSIKLLKPTMSARQAGYIRFQFIKDRDKIHSRFLLLGGDLNFHMINLNPESVSFHFNSEDVDIAENNTFNFFKPFLPMLIRRSRRSILNFHGLLMIPDGSKARVKMYGRLLTFLKKRALAPNDKFFIDHPELVIGFPLEKKLLQIAQSSDIPKIAVCVHLYYTELWNEVENLLLQWDVPFHLFLTLNREDEALSDRIGKVLVNATILVVENKGRDVRPFLVLLDQELLSGFDLVCKIHGKKSSDNDRIPIFGDVARRAAFLELIASHQQVGRILEVFHKNPKVGIVGPKRFLASSGRKSSKDVIGQNRPAVNEIAQRMGAIVDDAIFDFFEGTMFWVRPQALKPLQDLKLSTDFFDLEAGKVDGAPEHALERMFNLVVRRAGFESAEIAVTELSSVLETPN